MALKLDKKDARILRTLSIDARQSLSRVGREVGLSEEVVAYRLRNLVKNGILKRFRAEVDSSRLGYTSYRLNIRLEGADAKKEREIFEYLAGSKGAFWTALCEGRYNLLFRFLAKDEFELNEILGGVYAKLSPYIGERDITMQLGAHFYHAESGVYEPEEPKYITPQRRNPVEVDEKDVKILAMLAEDGRATSIELASKVGLTPNAVRYRIKRLEKEGVIGGYQLEADRSKLGMLSYKILLHFREASEEKIEEFARHCERMPALGFLTRSVGAWDMDIDLDFRSTEELHNAVLDLTSKFGDLVKSYETLSIFRSAYGNPIKKLK